MLSLAESYLIKGMLIGLVFGVPAGAIGALTIQRALAHGFWAGFVTGAGSTAADVLYACIGVFGLTVVSDYLLAHQTVISLAGSVFIIVMGALIFRKKGIRVTDTETRNRLPGFFGSSFVIAITNPATVLAFFIAFSSFGIAGKMTSAQGLQLISGIFIGTFVWWGLLSAIVSAFKRRITDSIYQKLNWILGGLMILFGVTVAIRGFVQ